MQIKSREKFIKSPIYVLLGMLVGFFVFYSVFLYWLRYHELRKVVGISVETVAEAFHAGDLDLALKHIQSVTKAGEVFHMQILLDTGEHLLGPVGEATLGLGEVCEKSQASKPVIASGCKRIVALTDFLVFFLFALCLLLIVFLATRILYLTEQEIHRKNATIASMTAMLAHDVRRPFKLLKMGLDLLQGSKDPIELQKLLPEVANEVEDALNTVHALVEDTLEIAAEELALRRVATKLEESIEKSVDEIFPLQTRDKFSFTYNLQHQQLLDVDPGKLQRVFGNILLNAMEALPVKGSIWFQSREVKYNHRDFVEVCIGNNGSYIPKNLRNKIFHPFYTQGKRNGTGLGLAIAEKIVRAHGGEIWCNSSMQKGGMVEFWFTLPVVVVG